MAEYRISGVWKNNNDVITHYAFHKKEGPTTIGKAQKFSKADAVSLLQTAGNSAITWIWNYNSSKWKMGEEVIVVSGNNGKFLRSNPDNQLTDNLAHLIDYDWISA